MFSNPPATTQWDSPNLIDWAPKAIVFIPEAQTLLMLFTGTEMGIWAPKEAYLAGFYPNPALHTLPILH